MPLSQDTKWVHSSSKDNKNPDRDLGGLPSVFEISPYPMNNLFDNILPSQAAAGLTDFRCFYIFNRYADRYIRNAVLSLKSQVAYGADVEFGTKQEDDVQKLVIMPLDTTQVPDPYGHVIMDVHFGPPITVYWGLNINSFAANLQAEMRKLPMCDTCTATVTGAWEVTVTFTGNAGKRLVDPIIVVANRLDYTNGGNFRVFPAGTTNPSLCPDQIPSDELSTTVRAFPASDLAIPLYPPIDPDSFSANGFAWVFNKCLNGATGGFISVSYTNLTNLGDRTQITFVNPLGYRIEEMDPVYIEPKLNDKFIIAVQKETDGSPIGTTAEHVERDTTAPEGISFATSPITLPWLLPLEGFYVWVKRVTNPLTPGKGKDGFDLSLEAEVYS